MALQKSKRLKASPSVQYPWRWEKLIIRVLDCDPPPEYRVQSVYISTDNTKISHESEIVCYLLGASFMNVNPLFSVEICKKAEYLHYDNSYWNIINKTGC